MGKRLTALIPALQRVQIGWCGYEAANSAFSTSVLTVLAGPYITALVADRQAKFGLIQVAHLQISASVVLPYLLSSSLLIRAFCLPWVGAWSDLVGSSRTFFFASAYVGSAATVAFGLIPQEMPVPICLSFLLASLAWGTSLVFYNALLPSIALPRERDRVSCYGSAAGFLGGALVLALHFSYLNSVATLHGNTNSEVRLCLWTSGVWWCLLTTFSLLLMRPKPSVRPSPTSAVHLSVPIRALKETLSVFLSRPKKLVALAGFGVSNCAVQTVITLTGQFATEELRIGIATLARAILFLQIAAVPFPLILERLGSRFGTRTMLLACLVFWSIILNATAFLTYTTRGFFLSLAGVSIVIASTQAFSRSLYSQNVSAGEESRMFSVYDTANAILGWFGPFIFALTFQLTGRYRLSLVAISALFIFGSLLVFLGTASGAVAQVRPEGS